MPSTSSHKFRAHRWTAFEQHALFCLICRQIPITGLPSTATSTTTATGTPKPTPRTRAKGKRRISLDLSRSIRNAQRDVADALNRALNFTNHEKDISVEEVSAMISQLTAERPQAVAYLERQRINRVTRSTRRVWERAGRSLCGIGGVHHSVRGDAVAGESQTGIGSYEGDQGLDPTNAESEDDPWGDGVAGSSIETQPDPWGEAGQFSTSPFHAFLIEAQPDPWGDGETTGTAVEVQDNAEANNSDLIDTTIIDAEDGIDPWGSQIAPTLGNDLADPWGDASITPADDDYHSNDPWTHTSSDLVHTSSPNFSISQAQSTASVSTAPKTFREQDFSGINPERLAMLDSSAEYQIETVQEPTYAGGGRGENAIELPFNRISTATTDKKAYETGTEGILNDMNDESDISEEE